MAQETVDIGQITRPYDPSKVIPISMTGFSGEADSALRFDLWIAGFEFVTPDKAQYLVEGSNTDRLEGRLNDRISKASLLAKAYSGDDKRRLAHAFANDIIQALTKTKGVTLTRIGFKVDTGANSEVYQADYDGRNPVQITKDASIVAAPTWVPGKRMLLYTSYKLGNPDIYSHDLSSGARQIVARYSGLNTSASVSPDGRRVAMVLSKGGSPDIYVADIDGTNLKQLTVTKEDESSPCWSPDGQTLCFVSRVGGRAALYLIASTGGGALRRLTVGGALTTTEPDWSPDGKTIVFTSLMGDFNICTIPAGGGAATVLATGEDPSWAPNSRTVVFARRVRGNRVLSLLDVPTKRVKDIQQVSGSCSQPCWAR
jgi:TolB protein